MGGGEQKMRFGTGVIPQKHARTFVALIFAAMAVTFSQGLMIPWMASVEAGHISPLMNSLSTSDTYAGLLVAMVFVGQLSRRIGLRRLLVWALATGTLSICAFVVRDNVQWWLLFRFVFGLSLGAIHYGTQSWIGCLTTPENRGKQMALYGLATGIGFAVGPMFLATGKLAVWFPFILVGLYFCHLLGFSRAFTLRSGEPQVSEVCTLNQSRSDLSSRPASTSAPIGIRVYGAGVKRGPSFVCRTGSSAAWSRVTFVSFVCVR
ncbi:hypothetical protein AYW79_13230 [Ferroacidibacillus organovorans]|uniref:Major facilitator superfamily (MFS) profile domain-containing protein n=2 Tax=Ferroacidibacillus organovorans TaxID=1765683 RepID=A0A853KA02_9BACL|nr:hypothetical protein AYJ22_13580 [Ferroacidibacillus organovorans]OAG92728.1 hypothetical protein AYW79_13230 [Ferroacidibacillus organovorans]